MNFNGRELGPGQAPYVVAELSANHNGSLKRALRLIEAAAAAGADAVKLQTYRADTITLECAGEDFQLNEGPWVGRTLYELYEWAHTPWEWHEPLFRKARDLGLTAFSTPFDFSAVEFLEKLDVPAYKIASFELVDLELIRCAARTRKPLIISTGMANADEIGEAVAAAREAGCRELVLLHCVSSYPAAVADCKLKTIPDMMQRFDAPVGLSDHTVDNVVAISAVALGACMIEKHVTLDRNGEGPDDAFSLEPQDLKVLCRSLRTAWDALGEADYDLKSGEKGMVRFRRSLYVVEDMRKGDLFTADNTRSIRPGYGLPPKYLGAVLGKVAACDVPRGTALDKSMVSGFEGAD